MFELVRFLHMLLVKLVCANFATITIMQILHITLPTCNTVHNLHVNRLGMCAKFAHVALI